MSSATVHAQQTALPGALTPARPGALARGRELAIHLVGRELTLNHRGTVLGWTWPLARQLVQLGVLVLVFGHVVRLGIPNYPVFVFSGLIAWTWFSTGIGAAGVSIITRRHLVFQPRCPPLVLPIVAIAVPLLDVVLAMPVLVAMLLLSNSFHWTIVGLPALFAAQFVLMAGIAWTVAALSVYLRDIPNIVGVLVMTLFYATPVFYSVSRVPDRFHALLFANPIGTLTEADRAAILGTPFPPLAAVAAALAVSAFLVALGLRCLLSLQEGFVDEL